MNIYLIFLSENRSVLQVEGIGLLRSRGPKRMGFFLLNVTYLKQPFPSLAFPQELQIIVRVNFYSLSLHFVFGLCV